MEKDKLDTLLGYHFSHAPNNSKLNHLEQGVWRKITIMQEQPDSIIGRIFASILVPKYRYASVTFALMVGLALGSFTSDNSVKLASTTDMLNFEVFSSNYQHLPSTLLKGSL